MQTCCVADRGAAAEAGAGVDAGAAEAAADSGSCNSEASNISKLAQPGYADKGQTACLAEQFRVTQKCEIMQCAGCDATYCLQATLSGWRLWVNGQAERLYIHRQVCCGPTYSAASSVHCAGSLTRCLWPLFVLAAWILAQISALLASASSLSLSLPDSVRIKLFSAQPFAAVSKSLWAHAYIREINSAQQLSTAFGLNSLARPCVQDHMTDQQMHRNTCGPFDIATNAAKHLPNLWAINQLSPSTTQRHTSVGLPLTCAAILEHAATAAASVCASIRAAHAQC